MKAHITEKNQDIRNIGILVFDGVVLADVLGIVDVYELSDKLASTVFPKVAQYNVTIISIDGGVILSSSNIQILSEPIASFEHTFFDALFVASGTGSFDVYRDPKLISWLQGRRQFIHRIAGICTGIFVLGSAGFLKDRKVTVHWALINKLLNEFPDVIIEKEIQIIEDGNVVSVSDVGLATDLALRFIGRDLGPAIAHRITQDLVSFHHRRDVMSDTFVPVADKLNSVNKMHKASLWLAEHWNDSISIIDVANVVAMSERNFTRHFKAETGKTPHEFLLELRLNGVRKQLSETDLPVDKIARRCGLLSGAQVAKLFKKNCWLPPGEYRKQNRMATAGAINI